MPPWLRILLALPLPLYSPVLYAQSSRDGGSSSPQALPALHSQIVVKHGSPDSAEVADAASGLSVRASSVTGSGVLMPGETFVAGPLTSRNSWRRRVEVAFAPAGLDQVGLVLKAVVTEDRRPSQFGAPFSHGITAVGQWQQNQTSALTLKFALLDSRLRYSGGISSSRYGEAGASASLTPDNPLYRKPMASRSTMQWHRVDATLWEGSKGKASAWFSYASAGEGYRNLQQTADMPFVFEGGTVEFGANLTVGKAKLSLLREAADSLYGRSSLTKGSLALGPLRLSMSREGWDTGAFFAGDGGRSRRRKIKAAARLAVRDMAGSSGLAAILPDAITFKLSQARRESGRPDSMSLTDSRRLGVEMERTRGDTSTRIGFAKGVTLRSSPSGIEPTKIDETWLNFSHSVTGKHWDLVAHGSVNLRKSAGRTDRFYSGGISLSLDVDNRPKLSIGVDANYFNSRGDIAAFDAANQGVNVSVTADFSYLLNRSSRDSSRYLRIKAYSDWSRTDFFGEAGRGEMVPTVLAMFGTRF